VGRRVNLDGPHLPHAGLCFHMVPEGEAALGAHVVDQQLPGGDALIPPVRVEGRAAERVAVGDKGYAQHGHGDAGDAVVALPADHDRPHRQGRQEREDARQGQVHPARREAVVENGQRLVVLGGVEPDREDAPFVVPGGQIARDGAPRPVVEGRRLRARDDDHVGVLLFHLPDRVQPGGGPPAVDGPLLLALLDEVAQRGKAVFQGHPVVVVDDDNGESPFLCRPHEGLHVVGAVAEVRAQVDEAQGRRNVSPRLRLRIGRRNG